VSFFDDLEPPEDDSREQVPRREKWRGVPEDTIGIPVAIRPLVIQNDRVAVIVSDVVAFSAGFTFSLAATSRLNPAPLPLNFSHPGMRSRREARGGGMRFGLAFADGTKIVGPFQFQANQGSQSRVLRPRGGSGDQRRWAQALWCEPLPSAGPMNFVCEWADYGIPETSREIDADAIIEASTHAMPIWPDDIDIPDDSPNPSGPAGYGSSTFGRTRT
jgi:hypothetical protein